ncbi:hypothetical protein KA405_05760 [Patescibacteria group bacterium]|nr:hypothetical protein [Patescibacteria group bacterium]
MQNNILSVVLPHICGIIDDKMITTLLKTEKTVFTTASLQTLFPDVKQKTLARTLYRYKQSGKLLNPQKGIWTLPVFDVYELACTIYPESYISLETVLYDAGVIFQRYGSSTRVVWSNTREKRFQEHSYIARKVKDSLLHNTLGVRQHHNYRMATPERALCDYLYLRPQAQLDNPQYFHNIQSNARLKELLPFYPQTVQNNVQTLLIAKI